MIGEVEQVFPEKARESLEGAQSEFATQRYNNCANRCYYATFQAAIYALAHAGVQPAAGPAGEWSHSFVQAQFSGQLVGRRRLYAAGLRDTLSDNLVLRQRADYRVQYVSETQARRALRRSEEFVRAILDQRRRGR